MMEISVVIPCYNSQNTLPIAVKEVVESLEDHMCDDYEIILVNDSSKDGTWNVICELCVKNKKIKGVDLSKNFGQTNALMAGFSVASGNSIMTAEDDCQSSPDHMWEMLDMLGEEFDIVCARNITQPKRGLIRGIGTRINRFALDTLLEKPKNISPSIFFVAKKKVIDTILEYKNAYPYMPGLILRSTSKIGNYDINRRERISGKSNYNLKRLIKLLTDGVTTFSRKPLLFSLYVSFFLSLILFVDMIRIIVNLSLGKTISTVEWLILGFLLVFILLFIVLSLMSSYIGRLYMVVNQSPQFIIRRTQNIDNY